MSEQADTTGNELIYLPHARTAEQLADMEDIAERGICFMCQEHIEEFYTDRGGLLEEGVHSYLALNGYPYEGTEHHLLIIPKVHVTKIEQLSEEFILEAFGFLEKMERELNITGGAIAMRFGNPAETGATAHHLHMHLIVPAKTLGPQDKPVRFRMSPKFSGSD